MSDFIEIKGHKIKPCPFCRSKKVCFDMETGGMTPRGFRVICEGCEAGGAFEITMERAVRSWNKAWKNVDEPHRYSESQGDTLVVCGNWKIGWDAILGKITWKKLAKIVLDWSVDDGKESD